MSGVVISRAWCALTSSIAGSSSSLATLSEIFSATRCLPSNVDGVPYVAVMSTTLAIAGNAAAICCIRESVSSGSR